MVLCFLRQPFLNRPQLQDDFLVLWSGDGAFGFNESVDIQNAATPIEEFNLNRVWQEFLVTSQF